MPAWLFWTLVYVAVAIGALAVLIFGLTVLTLYAFRWLARKVWPARPARTRGRRRAPSRRFVRHTNTALRIFAGPTPTDDEVLAAYEPEIADFTQFYILPEDR